MIPIELSRMVSVGVSAFMLLACSQRTPTDPQGESSIHSAARQGDRGPAKNRPDPRVLSPRPEPPRLLAGIWGGEQVSLNAAPEGTAFSQFCAEGRIDRPVPLDSNGRFDVVGTYSRNRGGPIGGAEPARFSGSITENHLTLTVILINTNEQVGPFVLERGRQTKVPDCPLV